jgi:type IV pilus assembly protein PilF
MHPGNTLQYSFGKWFLLILFFVGVFFGGLSASGSAQSGGGVDGTGTGGRHAIQGRIYFPSGRRSDQRVKVKLESYNAGELSVLSDANGSFRFNSLNPGSYTVVVDAGDEYEVSRERVYIDTDAVSDRNGVTLPPVSRLYTVQITLQVKRGESVKAGVVNAALASVPEKARELYQKAMESDRAGDTKTAIEQLKQALAIYPDFPLALNEIGVQYLKLGQPGKAAEALALAVKSAPQEFQPRLNYGIALLNQRKLADAESELRTALSLNSESIPAHMYLGITLAVARKLAEGKKELEFAIASKSPHVALAHRYLGGIYIEEHDYHKAADELEIFLSQEPAAADAAVLRQKIKELRSK